MVSIFLQTNSDASQPFGNEYTEVCDLYTDLAKWDKVEEILKHGIDRLEHLRAPPGEVASPQ